MRCEVGAITRRSARHTMLAVALGLGAVGTIGTVGADPVAADPGDRTIVAGTGVAGYGGDLGDPAAAQLRRAAAIEAYPDGSFVFADEDDHRVRVVSTGPAGAPIIHTLAGTGTQGYSGDHGEANAATLSRPRGLAVDGTGAVYVADAGNNRVRRISVDGVITTVAGTGEAGYSGDGGPARAARFSAINGLAVDTTGNLYIADGGNHVVRKVTAADGVVSTVAGTGAIGYSDTNVPATRARLARPVDVDVDRAGNLYIADQAARRVVKVDLAGILTTIAGDGTDGTIAWRMATETGLAYPNAVEVDESGDSVLIGTREGVYAVAGVGRIARASFWGEDVPDIPDGDEVSSIAALPSGDLLVGVGATVQRVERPVGHISGVVRTGVEGAWLPVAGVRVEVLDPEGQPVTEVTSDARGRYVVAADVGQWNVRFSKPGFQTFEFLGSAGSYASGVRVPLGGSVTLANPYLDYLNGDGTAVYGRVTAPDGTNPATEVVLHRQGASQPLTPVAADGAGRFLFAGAPPGVYTLEVTPASPWAHGWWSAATGYSETAVPFTLDTHDLHAAVSVPRDRIDITGTVVDNFGNTVLSGTVEAVDLPTGLITGSAAIGQAGDYRISYAAPAPAEVALRFVPAWDDATHLPTWLGGTDEPTAASVVALAGGDVVVDFHLPSPAYVDG